MLGLRLNHRALPLLAACLFLAYLVPYHVHPLGTFYNDWLAILSVTILLAFKAEQKRAIVYIPWITLIPLVIAAVIITQTMLGMLSSGWDAVLPVSYFLMATIATVLGASIAAEPGGSSRLCNALASAYILAGLMSVGIASLQFFNAEAAFEPFLMQMSHQLGIAIRPYANIAQPNQLALLLCISIASIWWLYQVNRLRGNLVIGITLVLLYGLALTQSRIGWLIMPTFAFFTWYWQKRKGFKALPSRSIAGLLLAYAALVITLPIIASALDVAAQSAIERVGTSSVRLTLIQQALQISLSHPWLGVGWGEFGTQQLAMGPHSAISVYSPHTHNIVMNFAVELGWPITVIVFGTMAYWFFKSCCNNQVSREVGLATLLFMAVFIHSLVEYPLWYAYVLMPVALLIGMAHQEKFGAKEIQISRIYVLVIFFVIASSLLAVAEDYRRVIAGYRALAFESLGLKPDMGTTDKPKFTIFPYFYDYFRFTKIKAQKGMPPHEIAFMERVAKRFGYPPLLRHMSLVYALNGRPEDAYKVLMTIKRLHSGDYASAYQFWKTLARTEPERYATVFIRLPKPNQELSLPLVNLQ